MHLPHTVEGNEWPRAHQLFTDACHDVKLSTLHYSEVVYFPQKHFSGSQRRIVQTDKDQTNRFAHSLSLSL